MNIDNKIVAWILRADGVFNAISGLTLLFFIKPLLEPIGWPIMNNPIYANTLGAAIFSLSLMVFFAANRPETSKEFILGSMIAKTLAGLIILYYLIFAQIQTTNTWFQYLAVAIQVCFVAGEGLYLLNSLRKPAGEQTVAQAGSR